MSFTPTISLVTPSFNQARFLGATLESVFAQNYPNLEYAVVDGGSTDGTLDLIASRQNHLAWWCSEADDGMYAALNKGFARVRGDIMGWVNSDDLVLPGALRAVGEIFSRYPEVQWLSSLALSTFTTDGSCAGVATLGGFSREAFLDGGYLPGGARHYGWIPQESTFWRRALWEKAGGHLAESLQLAGDFELWARFYRHAELIGTPTPLGGFRVHARQKSHAMGEYLAEARPALALARADTSHRTSPARTFLLRSQLADVPGLRGISVGACGYPACRVRVDADGEWKLECYKFL